jgi:hypothetical protein
MVLWLHARNLQTHFGFGGIGPNWTCNKRDMQQGHGAVLRGFQVESFQVFIDPRYGMKQNKRNERCTALSHAFF